jgi:acyl-CoA reductase-like NAD-dependent aldehyde dehydrogenase
MNHSTGFTMTIGGRAVKGEGELIPVINPATEEVFAQAPHCSARQLDQAVEAARTAFPGWAATPLGDRQRKVAEIASVILAHADELKHLLVREQGKPLQLAQGELQGGAYWATAFAKMSMPLEEHGNDTRRVQIRRVPLGVVGAIVPWNYPLLSAMMKIAPALTAGNSVVLKPAPTTPLTTLRLGELLRGVLPDGVLNVVSGGAELGALLVAHEGVDKISFTGSTATGKKIMKAAADRIKRFTLELGGNDAAVVLPDVDVEAVAQKIFWGAFRNSGQVCVAIKRVYVHEAIYERFFAAMLAIARATKMGSGTDPTVELGPIQNKLQFERVQRMAQNARESGLVLHQADTGKAATGYFFPVTLVDNPPDETEVVREEAFGPLLPIMKFREVDEVIARVNSTRYGLCGSVWSNDLQRASAIADRIESGMVWVNVASDAPPDQPMSGNKESGFGIENGQLGLLEYTRLQSRIVHPPVSSAATAA